MQPLAVALDTLNGMTKSMAKVEVRTHAAFPLILRDNGRFDAATALNGISEGVAIARFKFPNMTDQPFEKLGVSNQAILNDLSQPLLRTLSLEAFARCPNRSAPGRLMKRADKILAHGMVHTRLAAD